MSEVGAVIGRSKDASLREGGGRVFPEDLVSELGVRMSYSVKARSRRMWFWTKRAVWVMVQGARICEQLRMAEAQILRLGLPSGRPAGLTVLAVCPKPGTWLHRAGCQHTLPPSRCPQGGPGPQTLGQGLGVVSS